MTYRRYGDDKAVNPFAGFSASISWDSAAGTFLSNASTPVTQNFSTYFITVGETLMVDVVTLVSGTKIPSYNCTTQFQFTDTPSLTFRYAVNDLSWTCVSEPVNTWCTYSSIFTKAQLIAQFTVKFLAQTNFTAFVISH